MDSYKHITIIIGSATINISGNDNFTRSDLVNIINKLIVEPSDVNNQVKITEFENKINALETKLKKSQELNNVLETKLQNEEKLLHPEDSEVCHCGKPSKALCLHCKKTYCGGIACLTLHEHSHVHAQESQEVVHKNSKCTSGSKHVATKKPCKLCSDVICYNCMQEHNQQKHEYHKCYNCIEYIPKEYTQCKTCTEMGMDFTYDSTLMDFLPVSV